MGKKKYDQVAKFVVETPWAIRPFMLETIRSIVAARMEGMDVEFAGPPKRDKVSPGGAVAVLPLWGVMMPHADLFTNMSGGVGLDEWIQEFRALANDPSVSTIVLDIDSPGGAIPFVPEAAAEIRNTKKRVVAVANPSIGSAAFWLASQADEIIVPSSGEAGSIGVIAEHTDTTKMDEMMGVKRTIISRGDYKGEQWIELSDEAKAAIQHKVDQAYTMFITDVAKGRGVSTSVVEQSFGQGRMLSAKDALSVGMIDKVGTLDQVIARELPAGGKTRSARAEIEEAPVEAATQGATGETAVTVTALVPAQGTVFAGGPLMITTTTSGSNTTFTPDMSGVENDEDKPSSDFEVFLDGTQLAEEVSRERVATRGADTTNKEAIMEDEREYTTLDELAARVEEVTARMNEIHTDARGRGFTGEEQIEFDSLDRERIEREDAIANIREREQRLSKALENGTEQSGDGARQPSKRIYTNAGSNLPENVYDLSAYRGYARSMDDLSGLFREGALRVADTLRYETDQVDRAKANVERLLARDSKGGEFAQRILTTGSPMYDRAFGKLVMGKPLSSQEEAAINAAVSNTGLGSETPVPVTIDPTVILTSDGQVNPLREISRTVTITGNTWQGISSEGVDVTYEAELAQVADQTPTFDAPVATVAKAHAYVEFSIEVDQDWGELRSNLAMMFQDAKDAKEADKFLFGSGTNEPQGLLSALVAEGSSIVPTATINTFDIADVYTLRGALPPRFRARASWLASDDVYSTIRQADEAGGSALWAQLAADRPALLLGKPVFEASEMSGDLTVGGEEVLIYGDFSRGFIIVDRVGMNVELIPHVMGANRRPIGARALYAYFRNTSQLLTANAFRVLQIKIS